jgi:hypothetical protein
VGCERYGMCESTSCLALEPFCFAVTLERSTVLLPWSWQVDSGHQRLCSDWGWTRLCSDCAVLDCVPNLIQLTAVLELRLGTESIEYARQVGVLGSEGRTHDIPAESGMWSLATCCPGVGSTSD